MERTLFSKYPLSTYLVVSIFCILIVAVAGLVFISYVSMERTLSENARFVQLQTENSIDAVFKAREEAYLVLERSLDERMEAAFVPFLAEYERAGGDPARMDLARVKRDIGGDMELYVIDQNATIVATTYPPELGLRFGDYAPYFVEYLTRIRLSEGYFPDKIVSEKSTGAMRKFAYMPAPDHAHVLEMGLPVRLPEDPAFRYLDRDIVMEVEKSNPYLVGVRIFDTTLREKVGGNTVEVTDPELRERLESVRSTRRTLEVSDPRSGNTTRYLFVDLRDERTGSDVSRIIELSYTMLPVKKTLEGALLSHVIVGFAFLLGCASLAFFTIRKFTGPIRRMERDLDIIAGGNLDHPVTRPLGRDLLHLEESITRMGSRLKETLVEVRKSEENYRELVEGSNSIIMRCAPDGTILFMNRFGLEFFGYGEDEIAGKSITEAISGPAARAGEGGMLPFFRLSECPMRTRDGREVWVAWTHRIVGREGGRPAEILSIGTDISRQKEAEREIQELNARLEQKVEERTSQLIETIRNLESFTYSVSHDLRAPLRAISGYSSILLSGLQDIPPRERQYLERIQRSANEMGDLIDDLLTYSRIGGTALHRKVVDPGGIVNEVLSGFHGEIQRYRAEVRVGEMPPCSADPGLLKQVYHNLIGNALKFSRTRERPLVEVGAFVRDGVPVYYVRDNGIGFDMRYAEKIFGVFERLCDTGQYEGTGVGLAIARRIVELHGGEIWAESEPGRGATFSFTLGPAGGGG
ncbi:MAG: ATP-binding protein [Methanolinea sp.]|nr:ATP-binding protein [Methanolinea sp.]